MKLPKYDTGTLRAFLTGRYGMTISKSKGTIFIRANIIFDKGTITEFLVCVDRENSIFKLTERRTQGSVSILDVLKRHQRFPINETVRLKVKNVKTKICTAGY